MGTIIWLVGTILAIMAVMDVFKKNISTGWKIIWSVLLLVTGWIGLAVYYFFAKDKIEGARGAPPFFRSDTYKSALASFP